MLLADSNFWVAFALSTHLFHAETKSWLAAHGGRKRIGFCRSTQLSFLRLITTASVTERYGLPPMRNDAAWSLYLKYRADKRVIYLDEPSGLDIHWQRLVARPSPSPKLWMDAYLAAFAIAGNHRLITTDIAFRQFADLSLIVLGD